ncbi:hypothetical protein Q1695_009670 [Nippostrongylus brasiliensis]|nr:hypothetical protein Q1695_009670 [Nippostrongylus brasiliensis]
MGGIRRRRHVNKLDSALSSKMGGGREEIERRKCFLARILPLDGDLTLEDLDWEIGAATSSFESHGRCSSVTRSLTASL